MGKLLPQRPRAPGKFPFADCIFRVAPANHPGTAEFMLQTVRQDPLLDHIKAIESGQGNDFWSFRNTVKRRGAHALIHYPAMMVPSLQGNLLDAIKGANPMASEVLDPFVGSGTILVESMERSLNFTGIDINPLAALACLAKSGPYFVESFELKVVELHTRICFDRRRTHHVSFKGQSKWFSTEAFAAISLIARNIEAESELWARRLFWLALAKVVRFSCNSRTSTYKLHAKTASASDKPPNPLKQFEDTLGRFIAHLDEQRDMWSRGQLQGDTYTGSVDIKLGDSRGLLKQESLKRKFHIVMTSPPYGDNRTTIPYGQYAYLPMQWIPTDDIAADADAKLVANTYAIDTASLGGSTKRAVERGHALCQKYSVARRFAKRLDGQRDHLKRFYAFFCDLEESVDRICDVTATGGYQTWTIGNRRLDGKSVPMGAILSEMLAQRSTQAVGRISRSIHAKKMATRNNVSATMSTETIILAKKS